jgi:hypothetical protein
MDAVAGLPSAAGLVLAGNVMPLDPGPAVLAAMLGGWGRQQRPVRAGPHDRRAGPRLPIAPPARSGAMTPVSVSELKCWRLSCPHQRCR